MNRPGVKVIMRMDISDIETLQCHFIRKHTPLFLWHTLYLPPNFFVCHFSDSVVCFLLELRSSPSVFWKQYVPNWCIYRISKALQSAPDFELRIKLKRWE
jgi:hypothetical protein